LYEYCNPVVMSPWMPRVAAAPLSRLSPKITSSYWNKMLPFANRTISHVPELGLAQQAET